MPQTIITVGCPTDHGGQVISGDPIAKINGKPIAKIGDICSCPIHGTTRIVAGPCTARGLINGRPTAVSGDMTDCGAKLLPCPGVGTCGC